MISKLEEDDILFLESLYNPLCFAESMFSDLSSLASYVEGDLGHVRMGQIPLLSYEYLLDDNPKLTEKENFQLRAEVGTMYLLGGRNFGKTCTEEVDILTSLFLNDGYPMGVTSYDSIHLRGVLDPIINVLNNHPILSHFRGTCKRSPSYFITTKNNAIIEGINMNLSHSNSGDNFFQKHFKKLWIEEASFESDKVYKKRVDSKHELGCIERASGMCNFTKHSPCGKVFNDLSKKKYVLNLPQYINPFWDNSEKEKAVKKYGGEGAIGYRMFVKGETTEEGISVFDMERIRPYYIEGRVLKNFEINKQNFFCFEDVLILERPSNSESLYICADIGESEPTEIVVLNKVNDKYKMLYNITLYNLIDKEQFRIFKFLANKLKANYIGIDCTDGTGRAIFRSLQEVLPKENLCWVAFNEKIAVDFERDGTGNILFVDGKIQYKEEMVSEWSVRHLKDLLYDGLTEIPEDAYKFDSQINCVVATQAINRTVYTCTYEEDHFYQALQVWSIVQWKNEATLSKPLSNKTFFKGGV
jgi:hypothetical protein